ncbi:unnamed protein product [Paramecium octaurelia]|uniref:Uncharacterized protein n=1 Tax=Paramecium octaurelia TaxID=43137 RepID=A0A8S1UPM1_PAROT|nr:unnamed protein product [Paramecium octaurelia]
MGASQAQKLLQKAIETDNVENTQQVLKQFPELLNAILYPAGNITPLARASWRGCLDMVMLLCEGGANPDASDKDGLTPLMWAAKRDHANICCTLLRFHADISKRSREGFTALDYAILLGNYDSAYIIYEFDKLIQDPASYELIRTIKQWRYVNYEIFLQSLQQSIMPQNVGDYTTKPLGRVYNDPVVDPRESWKDMLKRIMKFDPPPICERSELPPHLQPQNRLLGRLNSYIYGMNPMPIEGNSMEMQVPETNEIA